MSFLQSVKKLKRLLLNNKSLEQKGGDGDKCKNYNIVDCWKDKNFNEFKYKWHENSCWIDASLVSLLGIGNTDIINNILKKCKSNNDDFCNLIKSFINSVNNTNEEEIKMDVKKKKLFYKESQNITDIPFIRENDFVKEMSYGSAYPIVQIILDLLILR